jgi:hypothetical protein
MAMAEYKRVKGVYKYGGEKGEYKYGGEMCGTVTPLSADCESSIFLLGD